MRSMRVALSWRGRAATGGQGLGGPTGAKRGTVSLVLAHATKGWSGASLAVRPAASTSAESRCSQRDCTVGTPSTLSARLR